MPEDGSEVRNLNISGIGLYCAMKIRRVCREDNRSILTTMKRRTHENHSAGAIFPCPVTLFAVFLMIVVYTGCSGMKPSAAKNTDMKKHADISFSAGFVARRFRGRIRKT